MKTTKIVDIIVCDDCHQEVASWDRKCTECGCDICRRCATSYSDITISMSEPHSNGSYHGTSVSNKMFYLKATYCSEHARTVFEVLRRAGFTQVPDDTNYPVLD